MTDPAQTPVARLIDDHWRQLQDVGGTPDYHASAEEVAFYRAQIRARARRAGIKVRTYGRVLPGGKARGAAEVREPTAEQREKAHIQAAASFREKMSARWTGGR